jgi:hypothetical protein
MRAPDGANAESDRVANMKLYASLASSFARKIRVMLLEKKVPHEVRMVNLWEPNDYKSTNPVGKVDAGFAALEPMLGRNA